MIEEQDLVEECLSRQLTELEALELIYDESICIDEGRRNTVKRAVEAQDLASTPPIALTVGRSPCLHISLPRRYPEKATPDLRWSDGAGRSQEEKAETLKRLEEVSAANAGYEHLMQIIQEFESIEEERRERTTAATTTNGGSHPATGNNDHEGHCPPPLRPVLARRLIYFHHIINKTKREIVQKEAISLGLGGYSKIGWPGVVVVEGEEENVKAYVKHLQTLRWAEIKVRGEERIECQEGEGIDDVRVLHQGFLELGEHDMSVLAQVMREAGLEDLFKTLMK